MNEEQDVQTEIIDESSEPIEEVVEESEVVEASSEGQEPEEPRIESKQKNRHPAKTRINQLQREKYRAQYEAQLLREENERLKGYNQQSNQAAFTHFDNASQLRLSQAKQALMKAQELGDISAITEATDLLFDAKVDIKRAEDYKNQQQHQAQNQQHQEQQVNEPQPLPEVMEDWLYQNPWCDPRNEQYDPDTASEVQAYAVALEKRLARRGEADKIGSEEYYEAVNQYIRNELYEPNESPVQPHRNVQPRGLNMSAPKIPTAGVNRGASSHSASPRKQVTLSADEKFLARNMRISEADWAKAKIEDIRIQKEKGRPYYG